MSKYCYKQKRIAYLGLLIGGLLLICVPAFSQNKLADFEFINIKEGFPKRGVTSITTDDQGFVWIGMHGAGLYKYDGINYTSFEYDFQDTTSINSNVVHAVFKDRAGKLWIGSDGGVNIYNRAVSSFSEISFETEQRDKENQIIILAITEDNHGQIYVGSNYNGLYMVDSVTQVARKISYKGKHENEGPLHILNFATSSSGNIYVATNLGLKMIDTQKKVMIDALIYTADGEKTIDVPLQSLMVDELNNLWIGTQENGIYKTSCLNSNNYSLKYLEQFPITQRRVMSLAQSRNGTVFCGTENDGLFILNQDGVTLKELRYQPGEAKGLKSNSVWDVYFDSEDRLWVGYYDKGIDVYDPNYRKFNALGNLTKGVDVLNYTSITGLSMDKNGNIWIATDGNGIHFLDKKSNTITPYLDKIYDGISGAAIQSVFIDSKENVWAGGWNEGIYLLKKGAKDFVNFTLENTNRKLPTNRVVTIAEDSRGNIWFGTWGKGIQSYNFEKQQFTHHNNPEIQAYGLQFYDVRKILIDDQDQLWVGSTKGLFKIVFDEHLQIKKLESFKDVWGEKFNMYGSFNNILSLYKSSNNELWIGTEGAGLLRYQLDLDSLFQYSKKNGFDQQTTSAIVEASAGKIWASGRSGITHLDTQTGKIKNYSKADGLISNDFNYNAVMKDEDGNLYFGNVMGGVNYFKPDSILTNDSDIKVYLTNLKLFNKTVLPGEENSPLQNTIEVTKEITLNYLQSVFTIEYTGINFTRSEKNQFAYYLEGLEDDWNYVGSQNSATYTSLKDGDYIFKVKAANHDGLWNETPVTLKIKVLPPWWRSNVGYALYLLLFLISLYIFYRIMRMRVLAREERERERQHRVQEQELGKKKFQFFTNISHEFRTPLTLIVNPLEDILNDHTQDFSDEINAKHLTIHKNAKRLQRLIDELMDFRKLSFNKLKLRVRKTEIVQFVHTIADYFSGEAIDLGIEFGVDTDIQTEYVWIDSGLIEKVLFNLLSNAFKITPAKGKIRIKIDHSEQVFPAISNTAQAALSIAVSDTGPGLSPEHVQHIFERFYQVENLNKSYYGGTGIGLEVVNNFVNLHKGKIDVKSKLNEGTTFIIHLPIGKEFFLKSQIISSQPSIADSENSGNLSSTIGKEKSSAKSRTLLLVEDNIELQNYLRSELGKIYNIKTANNGKEGVKVAIDSLPDLIITDVMMPKMDGYEFCKIIKEDIRTCHIPLLMLTAKSNTVDQLKGINLGADDFITKPFDMTVLKSKLNQLLSSRQLIFNKYFKDISESQLNKSTSSLDKDFIRKILEVINRRIGDSELNVETLAAEIFLSRTQLYRKIKALTGMSVNEFIRKIRLEKAKKMIEQGNINISEVCYAVGFSSPSYFSKRFNEYFGILPNEILSK